MAKRGRKVKKAFLSIDGWVNSTAKQCARQDVPIDTETVGAVLNAGVKVLFDKISHEKREAGETFSTDLFHVKIKERKERLHRNPATGEAVPKGATRSVSFKASPKLIEVLEEAFRKTPSIELQKAAAVKNGVKWVDPSDEKAAKKAAKAEKKTDDAPVAADDDKAARKAAKKAARKAEEEAAAAAAAKAAKKAEKKAKKDK